MPDVLPIPPDNPLPPPPPPRQVQGPQQIAYTNLLAQALPSPSTPPLSLEARLAGLPQVRTREGDKTT